MEQRRGAWIYCAIDAPDDTHDTLKEQFKQLIDYADQMELEVVGSSSDVGAKPLWERNGFRQFVSQVQKGSVKVLLIMNRNCLGLPCSWQGYRFCRRAMECVFIPQWRERLDSAIKNKEEFTMKPEDKKMVERIMGTGTMGYAYEYPYGGGARKEYMLALTPENLANFIGARGCEAEKIIITDIADRLVVNTMFGMLDVCPDQKLCRRIVQHLLPIQMGEKEAGKVLAVNRNVSNQYFAMEDEAVTMAEYQML